MNNNYEPFGQEWRKEIHKLRKDEIIMLLAAASIKIEKLETRIAKALEVLRDRQPPF